MRWIQLVTDPLFRSSLSDSIPLAPRRRSAGAGSSNYVIRVVVTSIKGGRLRHPSTFKAKGLIVSSTHSSSFLLVKYFGGT